MMHCKMPILPRLARALVLAAALGGAGGVAHAAPQKCPRFVADGSAAPLRMLAQAEGLSGAFRAGGAQPGDLRGPWREGRSRPPVRLAAAGPGETGEAQVSLTYVGHASFLIESPAGVTIVTDYNDYVRPLPVPMVATMNKAHDTHFSVLPDPGIAHVLRGWNPDGGPAHHELTLDDVWIRNVPTNIRRGAGTEYDANSIFVFEVAGLCIAHLGHLHHLLTPAHLEALGRIDVVLAPVDGSFTLDLEGMAETLKAIRAPLVIPMHYFSSWGLERFLAGLGTDYEVTRVASSTVRLSRAALPARPTVMVLPPGF